MQAGAPGRSVFHAGSHDKGLRHFHSTKMRSLTQCGAKANAARCDDRCSAVQRPMQRTAFFQPISPACLHKGMNCPARQPPHSSGIKLFEIRSRLAWTGQSSPYNPSTAFHFCPQKPLCPHPREQAGMHDTPPGVPRHLEKLWSGAPFLSSSPIGRASQCHHSSREPSCSHSTTVLCHPKGRRARHLRPRQKRNRAGFQMESSPFLGRDDKTRTCDLAPPRRVRYQLRYIPLPFICTAKVR